MKTNKRVGAKSPAALKRDARVEPLVYVAHYTSGSTRSTRASRFGDVRVRSFPSTIPERKERLLVVYIPDCHRVINFFYYYYYFFFCNLNDTAQFPLVPLTLVTSALQQHRVKTVSDKQLSSAETYLSKNTQITKTIL